MKTRILSHLLICIITCILVVPFSIVNAFTNIVEYNSGTFNNGVWTTYFASNNNGYIVLDEFNIQNVNQFVQALITKIDLNNYYDGVMEITLKGNISTNLWEYYLQGEGAYVISSDNTHITVNLVNCQQFYLVACCGNDNDDNFRPISIDSSSLQLTSGLNVVVNPTYIQNFRFLINWDLPAGNVNRIEYTTDSLNGYSYFNSSLNNISVNRLDAQFDFEIVNGNYLVTSWYWRSSTNYDAPFANPIVLIRDATNTNRHYESVSYFYQYISNSVSGYRVYEMTVYIPINLISQARSGRKYQISFQAGQDITNTSMVGFMFRGVVENIPDFVLEKANNDSTSEDLTQANNDLTNVSQDIEDFESTITTDFYNNMNNIDLDDYNIFTQLSDTSYYFKTYINDFFSHLGDFKALFIVPIIVTVLMLIIGWVI